MFVSRKLGPDEKGFLSLNVGVYPSPVSFW